MRVLELPNPKRCRPEMYGKSYENTLNYVIHISYMYDVCFSVSMIFCFQCMKIDGHLYMKIYEHLDGTSSSFGEL